jgi:sulfur carrier protein ThiS adenylyltransferase
VKPKIKITRIFEKNVPGITEILAQKTVAIAGLGGLGSNAAISLVRSGIGKLILADCDKVELSNLNRQAYFLDDVGKKKTVALAEYLKNINPEIKLECYTKLLTENNISEFFEGADLLIEAFDKAESKAWLIEAWCTHFPDRPIVCASGLSGYGKTELLKVQRSANIIMCGDGTSDLSMGLISSRVVMVANMQVNEAIEVLIKRSGENRDFSQ